MWRVLLAVVLLIVIFGIDTRAVGLEIGDSVGPVAFETFDGLTRVMTNYDERHGTVLVFLSARCPETAHQIGEINAIHERFRLREVLFVGICANSEEDGTELRSFLQRTGSCFPTYRDPSAKLAGYFGATVTPEFFLIDRMGRLVYHGGMTSTDGTPALEQAIKAVLSGNAVTPATAPAVGTPVHNPGTRQDISDPYDHLQFSASLVFDQIPEAPVHHCATIAEAPNGDLLCLWYGGSYESADDQALFLARLPKNECAWATPERLIWNVEYPPGNAAVFQGTDGRMWIVWGRMESTRPLRRGGGWSECRLMWRTSSDNGKTWSEDTEIPGTFGWLPRNAPLVLQEGLLALPVSGNVEGASGSFLLVLQKDNTWQRRGFMPGASQPTVIQRDNGELLALMRSHPRIMMSESSDNGYTWTKLIRSEHKNPGAGIAMTRLQSSRILLVYNDNDQSDRTPLCIIQSYDEGRTWQDRRILEADEGEFSYPCIIQASDGTIHLVYTYRRYTIKHIAFNEGWVTHLERPN